MENDENPLDLIFNKNKKGELTQDIKDIQQISEFFKYLDNDNINTFQKKDVIQKIIEIFKINRYIIDYFSYYHNKSIYLFLFDLYLKNTSEEFKGEIINLLKELSSHIDTGKETFEYLFQKLSKIYRGEEDINPNNLKNYLNLLYAILHESNNLEGQPKYYFSCSGTGSFIFLCPETINLNNNTFTIILNFKISKIAEEEGEEEEENNGVINVGEENRNEKISKLLKLKLTNNNSIAVDLKYPNDLILNDIKENIKLPKKEWIELIIATEILEGLKITIKVNGSLYKINQTIPFQEKNEIESIEFFNNFYGEVTSMTMFIHQPDIPGKSNIIINNKLILLDFEEFKDGIYDKKSMEKFYTVLNKYNLVDQKEKNEKKEKKDKKEKIISKQYTVPKNTEEKKNLVDDLFFIFSPLNSYNNGIKTEIFYDKYELILNGDIKNHRYQCYQKKISLVCNLSNFFPIAEMFLLYPDVLNEDNLELYLKIIKQIVKNEDAKLIKKWKVFKVLSFFLENYPNQLFTEKIIILLCEIGSFLFENNSKFLCYNYFKYILLNEKILSKYNEKIQNIFWDKTYSFFIKHSSQTKNLININRLCLILRFYDRNKYIEMCCENHSNMFKDQFLGNKKIMDPPLKQKLANLNNIIKIVIIQQDPKNVVNLFKLLSLDLSPCLTELIINIFISALQKNSNDNQNQNWKKMMVEELLKSNIEVIINNVLIHGLPDIRLETIKLLYIIYLNLPENNKEENKSFKKIQIMIKNCLLPQSMFYEKIYLKHMKLPNDDFTINSIIENEEEEEQPIKEKKYHIYKLIDFFEKKDKQEQKQEQNLNNKQTVQNIPIKKLISKYDKTIKDENNTIISSNEINEVSNNNYISNDETGKNGEEKEKINANGDSNKIITNEDDDIIKDEQNKNEIIEEEEEEKIVLILKDEIYKQYLDSLFSLLVSWIFGCEVLETDLDKIKSENKNNLKYINGLEILSTFVSDVKNNIFTEQFLNIIQNMIFTNNKYSSIIFANQNMMNSILDISFDYYVLLNNNKNTINKDNIKIYESSKLLITNIFLNSLKYNENKIAENIFPAENIEILFVWGNKLLSINENLEIKDLLYDYISEILFDLLNQFTFKNEKILSLITSTIEIQSNYYIQNYLIMLTKVYQFTFFFKLDPTIKMGGTTFMSSQQIGLPTVYLSSLRFADNKNKQIKEYWLDYKFFDEIYKRVRHLWKMEKLFKGHDIKKQKKEDKYNYILNKIILVKERKNVYQTELEFLCYENENEKGLITCPFNIIIVNLMALISIANNFYDNTNDMIYWIKELKSFIKFVIITSSNMTKINQLERYNKVQTKCIEIIALGLSFMKNVSDSSIICKDKISKYFYKLVNFCINIVYYQYNYNGKHKLGKKVLTFAAKPARNDLSNCAVIILFIQKIKEKSGKVLLSSEKKNIYFNQSQEKLLNLINNKDWNDGFFQNKNLMNIIDSNVFNINSYEDTVQIRFCSINELKNDINYKKSILDLDLLSNYKHELLKHSNNTLEKTNNKKNIYKKFKIQCFSWRGFWSDRKMFFEENKIKYKLYNHYTKTFMRPILVPILDINYYLPSFTDYDISTLFKEPEANNKNDAIINLDIDKELKIVGQNIEKDNVQQENYLRNIFIKSNKELSEILFNFDKEEGELYLTKKMNKLKSSNHKSYYFGCVVKITHHIKGVFIIDDTKLNFKVLKELNNLQEDELAQDDHYDPDRKTCFGSYFIKHPKDKDLYKISYNYKEIKWIFRRKYYYKNSALEIYTTTNKSFYFNLKSEEDRENIIKEICGKFKESTQIIDDLKESKDIFGNIIGYENTSVIFKKKKKKKEKVEKTIKLSKKINDWKKWKISNFEILMWLNIFGNRSYNDLSQYPVFPWLLSNYEDKNGERTFFDYLYRDLSIPMGMLELDEESIKRKKKFLETYDTLKNEKDEETNIKPYIFGCNYSNPIFVCYYLIRLFPFTSLSIELQGHGFDNAQRLFLSVSGSFYNSRTQQTDVRELIPEFFYLPEMFLNINRINLGVLENGEEVNDVKTPYENDPYNFIIDMKNVLENDTISSTLQNWIDLIFGSKARGKGAESSYNIFTEASYQENIDLNKIEDKSSYLRLVEFGLIPNQIMSKDCTKKDKKTDILKGKEIIDQSQKSNLKTEKCIINKNKEIDYNQKTKSNNIDKNNNNNNNSNELKVLKIGNYFEEKITIVLNSGYLVEKKINKSALDKKYINETITSIKLDKFFNKCNRMPIYHYPQEYNDKTFQIYEEGNSMIIGGYYDGKVLIINTEPQLTKTELIPFNEEVPVCVIAINKEEDYFFFGNKKGNIKVYKNDNENRQLESLYLISDQMSEISYIDCNNELNLWTSVTVDGYINLYSLPLCKLLRCIKVPTNHCSFVFLSSSPLPSIIAICKDNKENEIFVYSINGFLFLKQQFQENISSISSPIIFKDLNSNDYLAYISDNNIYIRNLPNLIIQTLISDLHDVYSIFTNKNNTILYSTNKNASEINIIKH